MHNFNTAISLKKIGLQRSASSMAGKLVLWAMAAVLFINTTSVQGQEKQSVHPTGSQATNTKTAAIVNMSVNSLSFDFGSVKMRTSPSASRVLQVANALTSNSPLIITIPSFNSAFSFTPSGTFTITPGHSQAITVYFSPTQASSTFNTTLTIANNSTNLQHSFSIALKGTGSNF